MQIKSRVVVVVCLLGTIVAGGSAHAQSVDAARTDKVATAALLITYGTTAVAQMYEAHTTLLALQAGARETNPLIVPFSSNPPLIVAATSARAITIAFAVRSIATRKPAAAVLIGAALNFSYLAVAVHNRNVAAMERRQRASR